MSQVALLHLKIFLNSIFFLALESLSLKVIIHCYMSSNFHNRNRWLHSILQPVEFRRSTKNPATDVSWHTGNPSIHPKCLKTDKVTFQSANCSRLDFLKSPLSCLFSTRRTKDFSSLIGANFSDPKTGRCPLTNQRSPWISLGSWPSIKHGTWNIPEHLGTSGTFRNIPEHGIIIIIKSCPL